MDELLEAVVDDLQTSSVARLDGVGVSRA